MSRALKIVVCVCWTTLALAPADAARVIRLGPTAGPRVTGPRVIGPRSGMFARRTVLRGGRRVRRGDFGYGAALGLAGIGLDPLADGIPADAPAPLGLPGPLPPAIILPPPPPPACPLVIEIGRGLTHKVRTRIVSGHAACR